MVPGHNREMRRLDRAMFAIFLLALLADVAWSQVPAVVGGDSASLILSAAGPLREGSGEAGFVVRRSSRSLRAYRMYRGFAPRTGFRSVPLASLQNSGWNAGWKRDLSSQWSGEAGRLALTDLAFMPLGAFVSGGGSGASPTNLADFQPEIASLQVYEHSGNPAP
jgi:hypothetical protein